MKIWQCAFLSLILIVSVWLFSYGIIKNNSKIEVNIIEKTDFQFINKTNSGFVKSKVRHHVPKFMLDLYENSKSVKQNLNQTIPDIVKSVVPLHAETVYPSLLQQENKNDNHMLIFNVPNTNLDEVFVKAELRVLTLINTKDKLSFGIERQIKISMYNETTKDLQTLEERHIYHLDNTWITFNMSNIILLLLSGQQKENILKIVITIKSFLPVVDSGIFKLSIMPTMENTEHDYPILLLFYTNVKHHSMNDNHSELIVRKRRYVDEDYEDRLWDAKKIKRIRNTCKRKPLYIDFEEIDYDTWIVQPSGYEAYQCAGKCFFPVAEYLSPTKHAIVQALLHSVSPSRVPRSCCVPTKLDSISVLYVDSQGVLTYRYGYKDMVVTECGCR